MDEKIQDLKPLLSDVLNRLSTMEERQNDVLNEIRANHTALVRLEGALETRVVESRGQHELTAQHLTNHDEQIKLLHARVSNLKRGITSAISTGVLAIAGMIVQWLSSR